MKQVSNPRLCELAAKHFAGKEIKTPKILEGAKIVTKKADIPGTSQNFAQINLTEALKCYNQKQQWGYD